MLVILLAQALVLTILDVVVHRVQNVDQPIVQIQICVNQVVPLNKLHLILKDVIVMILHNVYQIIVHQILVFPLVLLPKLQEAMMIYAIANQMMNVDQKTVFLMHASLVVILLLHIY